VRGESDSGGKLLQEGKGFPGGKREKAARGVWEMHFRESESGF